MAFDTTSQARDISRGATVSSSRMLISVGADSVSFALVGADPGELVAIEELRSGVVATFTDAVMGYAQRQGVALRGCQLYMSVAGVITGGTLRTTSGKWFISVDGLRAMTGIAPVVVNDVAALAWATTGSDAGTPFGTVAPNPATSNSRYSVVFMGAQGLGAACVDRRDGEVNVLDSEAGHLPFSPETDIEWELVRKVAVQRGYASYENLVAFVVAGLQEKRDRNAPGDLDLLATILGRYAASVTLVFAAWNKVVLSGAIYEQVRLAGKSAAFRRGFDGTGKMRSTLRNVPMLALDGGVSVLRGLSMVAAANAEG